jgi:hypothetical protein
MSPEIEREIHDSPIYWFALLEAARQKHNFAAAAQAKDQLERLGVSVKYRRIKEAKRIDPERLLAYLATLHAEAAACDLLLRG